MTKVRFIHGFRTADGPYYVPGDMATLDDAVAEQAIQKGAALRVQPASYEQAAPDAPPAHKMMAAATRKKG